jgi:hypothetical protein
VAAFAVPGYDVVRLLGTGRRGELWLARDAATGAEAALRRLRGVEDLSRRDALRRAVARASRVDHPHLVRLREVRGAGPDLVLVMDHVAGGTLAALLGRRPALAVAEAVTLAAPLAEALAAVHVGGLVHGRVSADHVLLAPDGRPVLGDLAPDLWPDLWPDLSPARSGADVEAAGEPPTPAADVRALAALCRAATGGVQPPALRTVLDAAAAPDPSARPSAAELAAQLLGTVAPAPIRLGGRAPTLTDGVAGGAAARSHRLPRRPDGGHRSRRPDRGGRLGPGPARRSGRGIRPPTSWPTVLAALALVAGLAGAVTAGVRWAGSPETGAAGLPFAGPAAPGSSARPPVTGVPETARSAGAPGVASSAAGPGRPRAGDGATRWTEVLAGLDSARAAAFAAADPAGLRGVYAPGSPALRRDAAALRGLRAAGLAAADLRLVPLTVRVAQVRRDRVVLDVEDRMASYRLLRADGSVAAARPGRGRARWSMVLVPGGQGWRVYDVRRR